MDWSSIWPAILAGGLAGQIVTLFGNNKLTTGREFNKWILNERYKVYSELLSLLTLTPSIASELDDWTFKIRDLSQRIHLLSKNGTAPDKLKSSLEHVFQLAQKKKQNKIDEDWGRDIRDAIRELRIQMSESLRT